MLVSTAQQPQEVENAPQPQLSENLNKKKIATRQWKLRYMTQRYSIHTLLNRQAILIYVLSYNTSATAKEKKMHKGTLNATHQCVTAKNVAQHRKDFSKTLKNHKDTRFMQPAQSKHIWRAFLFRSNCTRPRRDCSTIWTPFLFH